MKINQLPHRRTMEEKGIMDLLRDAEVGQLATVSEDGKPYVVPTCFVFDGKRIYFHCGLKGKKLDNIKANASVCFSVFKVLGLGVNADKPCNSWTYYHSVLAAGTAHFVEDQEQKARALRLISEKYARGPVGEMPATEIERTCVVEIAIDELSGKTNEKK